MFDRLKFSASAVVGLMLGIALALPLFWIAVKSSVGVLRENAKRAFVQVEQRQQDMADECLRLQESFKNAGVKVPQQDFSNVEYLRSRLAGSGDFEDQIEVSQQLERGLVNVELVYKKTMAENSRAAKNAFCRDFGLNWGPLKRYLVDEEFHFSDAVNEYNRVLNSPPVPFVVGHKSFGSLLNALAVEMHQRIDEYIHQSLAWIKFFPRWVWAEIRSAAVIPEPPQPMAITPYTADALFAPLPQPYYIAQAPVPEEDYPEIQYDRSTPDMADVEVGQQKAVFDSPNIKPFSYVTPTIQKTATY
jgi:hypothetical protein